MPYIEVENFKAGLDRRTLIEAAPNGSLWTLKNGHVNRGGAIEKAKEFVSYKTLPTGETFGFEIVEDALYVFGSDAAPAVPSGVTYQRLQHPDGLDMIGVVSTELFNGKVYAIAEFTGGIKVPFFDGEVVSEWLNGSVRAGFTNNDGIAEHLKVLADASSKYSATRSGSVITITGPEGDDYVATATAENVEGGTDDQTIDVEVTQVSFPAVAETRATGSITITSGTATVAAIGSIQITGGSAGAGNEITAMNMGSGDLLDGTPVPWVTSDEQTAENLAAAINANYTTEPGPGSPYGLPPAGGFPVPLSYYADGDTVYYQMHLDQGASGNSKNFGASVGGTVTVTNNATAGGVGPHLLDLITVGGVNLSEDVYYTSSNDVMAANLAFGINQLTNSHSYTAEAVANVVTITAPADRGSTENGKAIVANVTGTVGRTIVNMAGGANKIDGQEKKTEITVGGTFEAGDLFTIILDDGLSDEELFGADRVAGLVSDSALTLKNKIYATSESILLFSGVAEPVLWGRTATGSGLINMSTEASGSRQLTGLGIYQNNLAVFSRRSVQIWFVDPDPDSNRQLQVLSNIGTLAGKSVIKFGNDDLFFLSDSGIRSLYVADSSERAGVGDVGSPIDDIIIEQLRTLSDAVIANASGVIEPTDGRYWLALNDQIYAFSFFQTQKISAWSTYSPGVSFDVLRVVDRSVYARAGDVIYLYGGTDGNTYDTSEFVVELPFINADKAATFKHWQGIDVTCRGRWKVYAALDPEYPDTEELVAEIDFTTTRSLGIPFGGESPLIKLRFVNTTAEKAILASVIAHFVATEQD